MDFEEKEKKISRELQLTNAQLEMISTTGKISGEVKRILSCNDKNKLLNNIDEIHKDLKKLVLEIYNMSNALNLDFQEILGGSSDNI